MCGDGVRHGHLKNTLYKVFFFCYLYIEETRIEREMTTMKESQRTIPVQTYSFCKGCQYEMLNLHTRRLYADNNEYERIHTAKCRSAEICLSLYERLVENLEQDSSCTDQENSTRADMLESYDYSFCDDVSWEDRQI